MLYYFIESGRGEFFAALNIKKMDEGKEKSTFECEAEKMMKELQEEAFMEGYRYAIRILKESEVKGDWKK